ncbi:carbonic anhydrase [Sphingomonas parapaucimobilis]|jgi:carbonic anhydrase|uniref:Carbonic anhydrase n=1 Tax=Sphingomonas parapaucimobilis NBRC 15100 TaxID=1219049 RepID=A0A0A1W3U6_9SPHN|nr:carbonic anhydrase [Sphingomonas parapaucimobilis]GAL99851.1 carbonic anhydrase II [Sphingomonas parapaucimobilis NBRC 15100]
MREYKQLLLANKAWATELLEEKTDFFQRQTVGQKPDFLWIGCSDSRVTPEQMTMTPPGGMFLHRNIANLVHDDDLNLLSVVQYAVDVLKVRHVILCGHHGCGGVLATLEGGTQGPVDQWLGNARDVLHRHRDEIDAQPDQAARVNRLVEVNVMEQLRHLARLDTIQKAFAEKRELWLHGWVYDIRDGHIKTLLEVDANTDLDSLARPDKVLM